MVFSKSFPRTVKGSTYPIWEEIFLTEQEEKDIDTKARFENIALMNECIEDAKKIIAGKHLNKYQTDLVNIARSLFEKRASHAVFWKEAACKEKFDEKNK